MSSPLAGLAVGRSLFDDYVQTAAIAEQVVSCVGLSDYRVVVAGADGKFTHMGPDWDAAQATFNIAVTDPRWLEHVATGWESGDWEWDSTKTSITAIPTFDPAWRTPAVLSLAQQIAETQAFGALPTLADALQRAGCDDEDVLRHCRSPGPHVCGCWALDLVLGAQWLTNEDPDAMLRGLGTEVSARKLRLFAVACCRRVEGWAELADREGRGDDYRNAVAVAERFADGTATTAELATAYRRADDNVLSRGETCHNDPFEDVTTDEIWRAVRAAQHIRQVFFDLEPIVANDLQSAPAVAKARRERMAQEALLRDLFGNVFRPVTFAPSWRTDTVLSLAQGMYESRDFSALPILADALQDAGCDNDDVLSHCRGLGPHVRGCWVVDLVLGKE